ncbi:hypothetical protein, partial [Escherichia coli]|uniref:hypothetical protein n=1 Tax=Escherichia coli TaxID=562 RepID=UPI001BE4793A
SQSGLMPFANAHPSPSNQPPQHRNDLSFAGATPAGQQGGLGGPSIGQSHMPAGAGAMVPVAAPPQSLGLRADQ